MKTNYNHLLKAILIGFICLTTNFTKAQIAWPYPITNLLNCDVVVCYEVHDAQTCTFVCLSCPAGVVLISAGSTIYINSTFCDNASGVLTPISDVHVVIITVDGVVPTTACTAVGDPNTCIISCGGTSIPSISVAAPSNCTSVNINYSNTGTIIN